MKIKKKTVPSTKFNKLKPLFWDYEIESVKTHLDSVFVISRVLELGNPEQFEIFRSTISDKKIKDFLKSKKAEQLLSKKSLNFWQIYYGIKKT
jgi:hypothetical protein